MTPGRISSFAGPVGCSGTHGLGPARPGDGGPVYTHLCTDAQTRLTIPPSLQGEVGRSRCLWSVETAGQDGSSSMDRANFKRPIGHSFLYDIHTLVGQVLRIRS